MKKRLITTILVVLLAACACVFIFSACNKPSGGGNAKKAPVLEEMHLIRTGSENTDKENTMCLAVRNNKCETVGVELIFANDDALPISSVKVNGLIINSSDFRKGSTDKRVVFDYTPEETEGELTITVTDIYYTVSGSNKKINKLENNYVDVKIAPKFTVTFDFSESAEPEVVTEEYVFMQEMGDGVNFLTESIMDSAPYGKSGYIFVGWYTDKTEGEVLSFEDKFDFYHDITLYARYSLTFRYNTVGTGSDSYAVITGLAPAASLRSSLSVPAEIDGLPVKEIGDRAFASSFASLISLSEGIEKIGAAAFQSLADVDINLPSTVVEIGESAFSGCNGIKNILFSPTLKKIGANAFRGVGWDTVYEGYRYQSTLYIPNTIEEIGENCFMNSTFNSVYFEAGSALEKGKIGAGIFLNSKSLRTVLTSVERAENGYLKARSDNGLKYISEEAFSGCEALVKLTENHSSSFATHTGLYFAEGLTEIAAKAFNRIAYNNGALTEVLLPDSLSFIGESAFANSGLNSIKFKEEGTNSLLTTIGDWAFSDNKFVEVDLKSPRLTNYGKSPFYNSDNLRVIYIRSERVLDFTANKDAVQGLNDYVKYYVLDNLVSSYRAEWVFEKGYLGNEKVNPAINGIGSIITFNNIRYAIEDYDDSATTGLKGRRLLSVFPSISGSGNLIENTNVTIPKAVGNGIIINSVGTLVANKKVTNVSFEDKTVIEEICKEAFWSCDQLALNLNGFTNLKYIGEKAFFRNKGASFKSESALKSIGSNAFAYCSGTVTADFRAGNDISIGVEAFYQTGITTLYLGNSVKYIESLAFAYCANLTTVYIEHDQIIPHKESMLAGPFRSSGSGNASSSESAGEGLTIYLKSQTIIERFSETYYPIGADGERYRNFYNSYAANFKIGAFPAS